MGNISSKGSNKMFFSNKSNKNIEREPERDINQEPIPLNEIDMDAITLEIVNYKIHNELKIKYNTQLHNELEISRIHLQNRIDDIEKLRNNYQLNNPGILKKIDEELKTYFEDKDNHYINAELREQLKKEIDEEIENEKNTNKTVEEKLDELNQLKEYFQQLKKTNASLLSERKQIEDEIGKKTPEYHKLSDINYNLYRNINCDKLIMLRETSYIFNLLYGLKLKNKLLLS